MENDLHDIELLDNYLEGTLSKADEEMVKARLASDPAFATLLEDLKIMRGGIELSGMEKKLQELKKVDREMGPVKTASTEDSSQLGKDTPSFTRPKTSRSRLFSIWSVAASVVVLIIAGILLSRQNQDPNHQFAMQFSVPMEDFITVRGDEQNEVLNAAMEDYNKGEYRRAEKHFNEIYRDDRYEKYDIYYGYSLMQVNKPEQAIQIFEKVEKNDPAFEQAACFYRSLCLISENKKQAARNLLEKCKASPGSFTDDIEIVSDSLNRE